MLLLGLKSFTTSTGHTENDYSQFSQQQTDIIKEGTTEELTKFYNNAVTKGKASQKKYSDLSDNLEWSNISEKQYDKLVTKYIKDIQILKYDRVLIIEGTILK